MPEAVLDRVPDCLEQVAHSRVVDAVAALAHAAVLYERTSRFTELVLNSEHALWSWCARCATSTACRSVTSRPRPGGPPR
jgi:hypothetical protein